MMKYSFGLSLKGILCIHLHSLGLRPKGHMTGGDLGHWPVRTTFSWADGFSVSIAQPGHFTVAYWFELAQRK